MLWWLECGRILISTWHNRDEGDTNRILKVKRTTPKSLTWLYLNTVITKSETMFVSCCADIQCQHWRHWFWRTLYTETQVQAHTNTLPHRHNIDIQYEVKPPCADNQTGFPAMLLWTHGDYIAQLTLIPPALGEGIQWGERNWKRDGASDIGRRWNRAARSRSDEFSQHLLQDKYCRGGSTDQHKWKEEMFLLTTILSTELKILVSSVTPPM